MRTQVGRVLAAVVVVGAVVSGCAGGEQAGAAVIVGDSVVPLETVQKQVTAQLNLPVQGQPPAPEAVARMVVSNEIMRTTLRRITASRGITIPDASIDQFIESQGGVESLLANSGVPDEPQLRTAVVDFLAQLQLGQQLAPGLSVVYDTLEAPDRADAEKKARVLAAGGAAADALLADPRSAARRGVTTQAVDIADDPSGVVFSTPAGRVGYFQTSEQGPWRVFKVTERRTGGTPDPAAAKRLSIELSVQVAQRSVALEAEQLGIKVNPRFGEWDPVRMGVVGAGTSLGALLPATAS